MTSIGQKDTKPAKKQVRAVESPQVLSLDQPFWSPTAATDWATVFRTNIFPGAPLTWKSVTGDSYTGHPLTNWPTDPDLWYGHKTDEMVQWTERNIMNQKLDKILTEMEKKEHCKMSFLPQARRTLTFRQELCALLPPAPPPHASTPPRALVSPVATAS